LKMSNEAEGSVLAGNPEDSEPSWSEGLDEWKEVIEAKGWASNADLMKSYVNLEKAVGADKVVLPAADSDLADWDGWEKLGTPKEAGDYALEAPEDFAEYDQGLSDWFRDAAHAARLPAVQAQKLHDSFVERMMGSHQEMTQNAQAQNDKWENELRKDYGTSFDERVASARAAMREYGTPELRSAIDAAGLGSNPDLVRAFAKIGMQLGTGSQFKDGETSGKFGTTPDQAKEEIAALRTNPALLDATHPEHKVINDKLTRLTEAAFGTDLIVQTR
jgi:hypothetical protein